MIFFIVVILLGFTVFVSFTYLSTAKVNRRVFRRTPSTAFSELVEGRPAVVSGIVEACASPVRSPLSDQDAVRVHLELVAFLIGATREDFLYCIGCPAYIRDAHGGRVLVDFGAPEVRVRFIDLEIDEKPIDLTNPALLEILEAFDIKERCRIGQITPLGREAVVPVNCQVSVRGLPTKTPEGLWELKPIYSELMVSLPRPTSR